MRRLIGVIVGSGVLTAWATTLVTSASARSLPETQPPPPTIAVTVSVPPSRNESASGSAASSGASRASGLEECGLWRHNEYVGSVDYEGAVGLGRRRLLEGGSLESALARSPEGTASLYQRVCNGDNEFVWLPDGVSAVPPPTVDDLAPGALADARRSIPLPELNLSPAPDAGGVVNLGMWLAVEDPVPVTARASAGGVWAQVTASLDETVWSMGNGDVVVCDGAGDTIADPTTAEPSPECGYVYRLASTPEHTGTGELVYRLSVTARWQVRLTGSDGRDVVLAPIETVLEVDYPVREVQTVGGPG